MASTHDSQVYKLKNGRWAYRFCISVNGKKIAKRGKTDSEGNPLQSKSDAIKARKKAIKLTQMAPLLPDKKPDIEKRTVREVFKEYCEKGRADRAYQTIRKQDSIWENHLDSEFGDCVIDEIPVSEVNDYLALLYYGNLPSVFIKYYPSYANDLMTVTELARILWIK